MVTESINDYAPFAIASIEAQHSISIKSPNTLNKSRYQSDTRKRRRPSNNFANSLSSITELDYRDTILKWLDTRITYTENLDSESKIFSTKFPELNPAVERLEKLNDQIEIDTRTCTLDTTLKLLARLFEITQKNNLWWALPLINIGFDSEIVLEWWHKDRKLDFDILSSNIDYVKVWGADIDSEMEDGSITISINESVLTNLWKWIAN